MSKEIDEKVVSMQFDNRHFEKNVQTTMSTLDKLKQKLHLPGATKGLQEVDAAARKLDLSPIGRAAETVGLKFNAMYTMADQAFRRIVDSAMNAGKRITSALTIDPIKTGFNEYELKMDSIKTILASTESQGETLETVSKYLEELNEYSDQTIYSFSDMTQNIGKFTNAGVKLEDAVMAIKGISNEAALSGANANEASRAMYNFAQALSVGYIQRIDWKSIELANMATLEFKEQLLNAAIAAGTVQKNAEGMYTTLAHPDKAYNASAMFTETLDDQWLTTEVLIETLKDYSDATTDIGKRAFAAAQDVTKLSQMFDILKETAQSGWARTWEILVGDLNQAKALFTPLTDFFAKLIDGMNDARNAILQSAFGKSFKSLMEPLKGVKKTIDGIAEPIKTITKSLEDYNKVVKEVINGDWGHTEKRWNALTEAGYDWKTVQNMVNEELGCSLRRATDFTFEQSEMTKSTEEATEANSKYIATLAKMSDEELRDLNLKPEQIDAIKQIRREADKLGMSVEEFIDNIDKIDGRWVVLEAFKNVGKALGQVFSTIAKAWKEIFPPKSTEEKANALYNLMAAFHKFSRSLSMSDDTADKLKRTLKGVFAILDIITTITGGAFKMAFKIVAGVLKSFDLDILDVTAAIGDAIVKVRDWVDAHNIFTKGISVIIPSLKKAVSAIKDWIDGFKEVDNVPQYIIQGLVNGIKSGLKMVGDMLKNLGETILNTVKEVLGIHSPSREFYEIGVNIIQGLVNGLTAAASAVWKALKTIAQGIIDFFTGDVASAEAKAIDDATKTITPKAKESGKSFIGSLAEGIGSGIQTLLDLLKTIGTKLIEFIKDLDLGTALAGAIGGGIVFAGVKLASAIGSFASAFEGLGDMFEGLGEFFQDFGKGLKSFLKGAALNMQAKAILTFAIALGILVVAIIALTTIDTGKMWIAIGALAALAAIMGTLAFAASKMGDLKGLALQAGSILAIAAAILIMAKALTMLQTIDMDNVLPVLFGLGLVVASLVGILAAVSKLGKATKGIDSVGTMLLKFSAALLIMLVVIKLAGQLDKAEIKKGIIVIGAMSVFAAALITVSYFAGKHASKAGSMLLKFSLALLIMVGVIKLAGSLTAEELKKGVKVIGALTAFTYALIAVSLIAGQNAAKAGAMMLMISGALLIMAGVIKIVGTMDASELIKGLVVIGVLNTFIYSLITVSALAGDNAMKAGVMLLSVAGALAILTGIIFLLSMLDPGAIAKGVIAIAALEACFAGLIAITYLAKDSDNMKTMLITMTTAIGLLAVALIALSLIDPSKLAGATAALVSTMGAFALMIAVTKIAGDIKAKTLISLIAVVGILAGVVALLAMLDSDTALSSAIGLSALLVAMAGVTAILSKVNTNVGKAAKGAAALATMALPLLAFTVVLSALSGVDAAAGNIIALLALTGAMSLLLIPLTLLGSYATGALGGILALTAMAVPLLAFVAVLMLMELTSNATENVNALITLMSVMSLLLVPLTLLGGYAIGAVGGILALTAMAVPMLAFIGVLSLMSDVPNAIVNAFSLAELMTVMSDVLVKISIVAPLALLGITAMGYLMKFMTAVGVFATAIGALMTWQPDLQKFLDTGLDLFIRLASGVGEIAGAFITGFFTEVAEILPMLATQLSNFMTNLQPFIAQAATLDENVIAGAGIIAAAILAISGSSFVAGIATLGGLGLVTVATSLNKFGKEIKPFFDYVATIKPEAITGVKNIAEAILMLTAANILDGLARFIGSEGGLEKFSKELPKMGEGLRGFIDKVGALSPDEADTIITASNAVKALASAASEIPNTGGLLAEFVGDNKLDTFATMFPALGIGLRGFLNTIGTFTEDEVKTVTAAADAVKSLAAASAEIPNTGGLLAEFVGDNKLSDFANMFPLLGGGLRGFISSVGTFSDEEGATVTAAADAVKSLAAAAKDIPNSGGWVGKIVGNNDLDDFADGFPALGKGLKGFLEEIGTFTDGQLETVEAGADAVKVFAEVAQDIPNSGGWVGKIVGDNDLKDFAEKIPYVGQGIRDFADNLGEFTPTNLESMELAISTVKLILELANLDFNTLAENVESFQIIAVKLAEEMPAFIETVIAFSKDSGTIDQGGFDKGIAACTAVASFLRTMPTYGVSKIFEGIGDFKTNITTFAEGVGAFAEATESWSDDDAQSGVVVARKILDLKSYMPQGGLGSLFANAASFRNNLTWFVEGLSTFCTEMEDFDASTVHASIQELKIALNDLGSKSMGELALMFQKSTPRVIEAINESLAECAQAIIDKKLTLSSAAKTLGDEIANGFSDKKDTIVSAVKSLMFSTSLEASSSTYRNSLYSAGEYAAEGFANGLSSENSKLKATVAAKALARAAIDAAEEELDENSPSKVFEGIGGFAGQGFVNGLTEYGDASSKAGSSMAESAIKGVSGAIGKIKDAIEGKIDSQPTIRPVLDLSSVNSGVGVLNSMLSLTPSVGVKADLNSISTSMSNRQNGNNNDVVSAINDLKKSLGDITGDVYNIDGITYDDNSSISSAVKSLVHAALIERRI